MRIAEAATLIHDRHSREFHLMVMYRYQKVSWEAFADIEDYIQKSGWRPISTWLTVIKKSNDQGEPFCTNKYLLGKARRLSWVMKKMDWDQTQSRDAAFAAAEAMKASELIYWQEYAMVNFGWSPRDVLNVQHLNEAVQWDTRYEYPIFSRSLNSDPDFNTFWQGYEYKNFACPDMRYVAFNAWKQAEDERQKTNVSAFVAGWRQIFG